MFTPTSSRFSLRSTVRPTNTTTATTTAFCQIFGLFLHSRKPLTSSPSSSSSSLEIFASSHMPALRLGHKTIDLLGPTTTTTEAIKSTAVTIDFRPLMDYIVLLLCESAQTFDPGAEKCCNLISIPIRSKIGIPEKLNKMGQFSSRYSRCPSRYNKLSKSLPSALDPSFGSKHNNLFAYAD